MLATGVLANAAINPAGANGLIYGGTRLFGMHVLALGVVAAFVLIGSFILYKVTDMLVPLRVKEEQEAVGLDLSQHGKSAFAPARSSVLISIN